MRPERSEERSQLQLAVEAFGGPEAFLAWWQQQDADGREAISYDWQFVARPKQLPPPGNWSTWHLRAGRGFGKTRTGAEWVRLKMAEGCKHIALVAPTAADARDVMVEGPSGILKISPPWERPLYEPSKRRLTWPSGTRATLYSAEEPDRLRGPQHDAAWCDELAAWFRREETWDMLQFGLRMGSHPQCLITSTPRGLKFLRDIEKDPTTVTTTGSTYENRQNLAGSFLSRIEQKYSGTRLGLQEIEAQILDDNPNALWKRADIDRKRLSLVDLSKLGVHMRTMGLGLDPAVTSKPGSNQTGIVAAGCGMCPCGGKPELHAFVLEDATDIYTPSKVCEKVIEIYDRRMCNEVVGETNQGGEWIEALLRTYPQENRIKYCGVHAKDGKRLRAEPVASLYEQGRVHHVGMFPHLEDQLVNWDPKESDESPDDLDALVHVLTRLLVQPPPASYTGSPSGWKPRR